MEVTVKSKKLSLMTSLLVSCSFVIGILAADLTKVSFVPAAEAQGRSGGAAVTASLNVANAELRGGEIIARGVIVNGVATDAVFNGKVGVVNSVLVSDSAISFDGIIGSGTLSTQPDGIIGSGTLSTQTDGIIGSGTLAVQTDGIIGSGTLSTQIDGIIGSGTLSTQTDGIIGSGTSPTQGGTVGAGDITSAGGQIGRASCRERV